MEEGAGHHRGRALEDRRIRARGETRQQVPERDAQGAGERDEPHPAEGRRNAQEIEERQRHRRRERRVVGDDGDLQVGAVVARLEAGQEREPLEERMEEERGESHLGGDAHSADAAAREQVRSERARRPLQKPGQHETRGDPEQRRGAQAGQHLGKQVEGDHSGSGGEGEGAGRFEQQQLQVRGHGKL